jgi:hypothetical protein
LCNGVYLRSSQLRGDDTHLLVDVILARALREGRELALDIRGVLAAQWWSPELLGARSMTRGTGRDPTPRIAGKDEAHDRIALAETSPILRRTFAGDRQQSSGTPGEIARDILNATQ